MIEALFARGHAADVIVAVMAVEGLWLTVHRGWPVDAAICRLMPGALIVLALRGALTGAAWPWIATPLILSLPFHAADLRRGRER